MSENIMKHITEILTSEDKQKIRNALVTIIINTIKEEFNERSRYIVDHEELYDISTEIIEEVKEQVKEKFTEKIKNIVVGNIEKMLQKELTEK